MLVPVLVLTLPTELLMEAEVAPEMFHERVAGSPAQTKEEMLFVNELMIGAMTVTEAVAVEVPLELLAESVHVVEAVMLSISKDPELEDTVPMPWSMLALEAFVSVHERVEDWLG